MKESTKNTYHERIHNVLVHIQTHLDDDLSLESLAKLTHFSPIHFHRIFKGMMGETVVEHIRRIRLERAAIRMACGQSNVTDESFAAGYETVESFSRAFKKMFGCAPSKYHEKHWEQLLQKLPGAIHYLPEDSQTGLNITPVGGTDMEVTLKTIEEKKVVFIRYIGPYSGCITAWNSLCMWAYPLGLCTKDAEYIGVCYDDPQVTPSDKIRYDACITVSEEIEGQGEIGTQVLSGGEYAVTLHKGSYDNLESTYAQLMGQWLPESGREFRESPSFEIYLNDPQETPPDELLTEIYLPLK